MRTFTIQFRAACVLIGFAFVVCACDHAGSGRRGTPASLKPEAADASQAVPVHGSVSEGSPDVYVRLHDLAADPKGSKWVQALASLAEIGDRFTLEYLEGMDRRAMDATASATVDKTLVAIRKRVSKETEPLVGVGLERMLERAAWADIQCDALDEPVPAG